MRQSMRVMYALFLICFADSAKILGIFHIPAFSHFQQGDKIFKELAARGHEVTAIVPYAEKTPIKNYKSIVLTGLDGEFQKTKNNLFSLASMSVWTKIVFSDMISLGLAEHTLNHTNVRALLKSQEKFDLVIIEQFRSEALQGFCHFYNAPCVLVSPISFSRWSNSPMGNPGPPSYVPDVFLSLSSNMNFWERLYNSAAYLAAELFFYLYTFRQQNALLQKYFPEAPHLSDLHYNISLMLLNSHVSTSPAVPSLPNMIDIGGFHVNPPKKLPKDLQDFLDGAKEGVIYFSMGSNLKSKDFPKEKREAILKVFSKLKEKVLWKWEDDVLPGQPPNVKLGKWLPQQDILAHPNVKVFLTHGGLLSTIETIYHGKPIVGIPMFGDQEMNVANAEIAGFGIGVKYHSLTEESLRAALNKILTDPKYAENAKRRSTIMHDQPVKPLDRAMFWIEHVLRHQGAPHLRTAALNLTWYQYLLLDVVALVAGVLLVGYLITCAVLKRLFRSKKVTTVSSKKKKN